MNKIRKNQRRRKIIELEAGYILMLITTLGLIIQILIDSINTNNPAIVTAAAQVKETNSIKSDIISNEIYTVSDNGIEEELESNEATENATENINIQEVAIVEEEPTIVNEDDLYWLSHLIMAEEEGACYENKIMCGLVAMNRVKDESFPDTLEEVIFQADEKGPQYACIQPYNGREARIWLEPNEDSIRAAKEILSGNSIQIPPNVVYQSERPLGSGVYCKIENQYYSYK